MSATSDFYRAQAEKCLNDAATATLTQVRDRNLRAAEAWQQMADKLIRAETARAEKEQQVADAAAARSMDETAAPCRPERCDRP